MQKISGILPGSSRVTSVDLKSSRPVRPGVPNFGAPQGESNLKDQVTRTQLTMQDPNSIDVPRWRSKEDLNAEIARNITDQFFRRRVEQPQVEITDQVTLAETSATPMGLDMMDVVVDDLRNDNNVRFEGFNRDLDRASDESSNRGLVAEKQENINAASKKSPYFKNESQEEDRESLALDTVA